MKALSSEKLGWKDLHEVSYLHHVNPAGVHRQQPYFKEVRSGPSKLFRLVAPTLKVGVAEHTGSQFYRGSTRIPPEP